MKTKFLFVLVLVIIFINSYGQVEKTFNLPSPDGHLKVTVTAGKTLRWSIQLQEKIILAPSAAALTLQGGEVLGTNIKIVSSKTEKIEADIAAINYKKTTIKDHCQQLTIRCKGDYEIVFRVYDAGVAYRFVTSKKKDFIVQSEQAEFNFPADYMAYIPYVNDPHNHDVYETSFENLYQHVKLSDIVKDTLAFTPVLVESEGTAKVVITEADLEDYPGMFLEKSKSQANALSGRFAPAVLEEKQGGHNNLQAYVTKRAPYLASVKGTRSFPWRVVVISQQDKDLLNNDLVYTLASPSRLTDLSWVKPGKVAWDWWNDWNISHVDFKAGINTATYKYYIDFASSHQIEYILLDEGWADSNDIMKIVPEIDLQAIVDYGKQKNVGVWLWGGWLPLDKKMDEALAAYAKIGIRGFKIDFMDRDDQKMVQFFYRLAKKAADYKIMLDFHGAYKPTGIQRTFPNVVNFEGVRGLENTKWSAADMPGYDATIPFIRMVAGPLDYTPGAMLNASKSNFRAINSAPMSQGTRCHQLAMYVVYEAPFEMLCDNPNNYMRESECLNFISAVPTTFEETVALEGKVGAYAGVARKKKDHWYVGLLGDWSEHDVTIDLSFLGAGSYEADIFKDGVNANRNATDYKHEILKVTGKDKIQIHLSGGGGWAADIHPSR